MAARSTVVLNSYEYPGSGVRRDTPSQYARLVAPAMAASKRISAAAKKYSITDAVSAKATAGASWAQGEWHEGLKDAQNDNRDHPGDTPQWRETRDGVAKMAEF